MDYTTVAQTNRKCSQNISVATCFALMRWEMKAASWCSNYHNTCYPYMLCIKQTCYPLPTQRSFQF